MERTSSSVEGAVLERRFYLGSQQNRLLLVEISLTGKG
jgi:hypothetical protein